MQLISHPGDPQREFLFETFEKTLPDVAERSYVVGEDAYLDGHATPLVATGQRLQCFAA